jgi:hypothetical protein
VNLSLLLVGVVKLAVGILLGGVGVTLAYRLLARRLKSHVPVEDNVAIGVLHSSALVALAMLTRNSLSATYDTIDLAVHRGALGLMGLLKVAAHSVLHIGLALVLGSALLTLAVWLFNALTPGVDEVAQVAQGKVAPALVLGAILLVFAILAAPGLEAVLSGLVPFPELPTGTSVAP